MDSVIRLMIRVNPEATVVVKSTVPVGYTEDAVERFHCNQLLFSPEFLWESKALYDNLHPSRIIFGVLNRNLHLREKAEQLVNLLQ